jgi:hypothetical protein
MKRLFLAATLLIGIGCSGQTNLGPIQTTTSDHLPETSVANPATGCREYYNSTGGVETYINSSGGNCGPLPPIPVGAYGILTNQISPTGLSYGGTATTNAQTIYAYNGLLSGVLNTVGKTMHFVSDGIFNTCGTPCNGQIVYLGINFSPGNPGSLVYADVTTGNNNPGLNFVEYHAAFDCVVSSTGVNGEIDCYGTTTTLDHTSGGSGLQTFIIKPQRFLFVNLTGLVTITNTVQFINVASTSNSGLQYYFRIDALN